jgi:hypothetical protein
VLLVYNIQWNHVGIEIGALFNQAKLWSGVWSQTLDQLATPHLMLLTPPPDRARSPENVRQSVDDAKVELKEELKTQIFAQRAPPPPPEPKEPSTNRNKGPTGRIAPAMYGLDSVPRDSSNKRGHVVPRSTAPHPRDRWETLFVYAFINKFTRLHETVPGFHSCDELVFFCTAPPSL